MTEMRIAYLCSSLEAGKDGVGDYTRSLALTASSLGTSGLIIALNDRHLTTRQESSVGGAIKIHRFPSSEPSGSRLPAALEIIGHFSPDCVSWQFVPYGYHPKGVTPVEIIRFASSLSRYKTHFMAHELWLGLPTADPFKHRVYGWFQRKSILKLLKNFNPHRIHTSNSAYLQTLTNQRLKAEILPLFCNIPITTAGIDECRDVLSKFLPGKIYQENRPQLTAITFGTLPSQWQPDASASLFKKHAAALGSDPVLIIAGRAGSHEQVVTDAFENAGISVRHTGDQSVDTISKLMLAADFGISPHSWALVGKSSSTTTMREHGLPILMPRDDWKLRAGPTTGPPQDPLLAQPARLSSPQAFTLWLGSRRPPKSTLEEVTRSFIDSLS